MVWPGSELHRWSGPTPHYGQRHLLLDKVTQRPFQSDLEHYQGWGIHNLSGQHFSVFYHPIISNFFIISKPIPFQFKTIAHSHVSTGFDKKSIFIFLVSLKYWEAATRSPWSLLFSRLNSPKRSGWRANLQKEIWGCWSTIGSTWVSSVPWQPRGQAAS